jgi:hypothetical protein
MRNITTVVLIGSLYLSGCSKSDPLKASSNDTRVQFLHSQSGQPLPETPINVQKWTSGSGWGGFYEALGQMVTDRNGSLDFHEQGQFLFQPEEDSLWNPFPSLNPGLPQYHANGADQVCFLFPVTMLSIRFQKAQFMSATILSRPTGGIAQFPDRDLEQTWAVPNPNQETQVHLIKGVENKVKVSFNISDGSARDTLISITPTTGEKIKITLPF